jgi:hypothetical protein
VVPVIPVASLAATDGNGKAMIFAVDRVIAENVKALHRPDLKIPVIGVRRSARSGYSFS